MSNSKKQSLKEIVEFKRKINFKKAIDSTPLIDNNHYYEELVHGDYEAIKSEKPEKRSPAKKPEDLLKYRVSFRVPLNEYEFIIGLAKQQNKTVAKYLHEMFWIAYNHENGTKWNYR